MLYVSYIRNNYQSEVLSVLLTKILIILAVTFRSDQFDLISVYGVRQRSNFILLHVVIQLSQSHLFKGLFFFVILLIFKKKNHWSIVDLQCCDSFRLQHSESVIHIHIFILFQILPHTGYHRILSDAPVLYNIGYLDLYHF